MYINAGRTLDLVLHSARWGNPNRSWRGPNTGYSEHNQNAIPGVLRKQKDYLYYGCSLNRIVVIFTLSI